MPAEILQLCPLMPGLEAALRDRFTVHRLFEEADAEGFVAANSHRLRGVVTGGHLGIPADLAAKLTALEIVAINGVGFDKVDLAEAKRRGFRVSNTPDVLTEDVADLAIGLVIAALRGIARGDAHVRAGRWPAGELPLGAKVSRRRVGIFGFGRIGRAIARRLEGFDATIAYCGRRKLDLPLPFFATPAALAEWSDILVVAASASVETRHIIGREVIDALGPKGLLVNVARGSLVDEAALLDALENGRLAGAALDVFADEPRVDERFLALPNVVLTPHIASATHETRQAMADLVLANLDAHFGGRDLPSALV